MIFLVGGDESWADVAGTDGYMAPEAVSGAEGEVARVLACATHYQVLEVASNADEAALKRAKKLKQLATHPDKLGPQAVGAGLAFQRVVEVGSIDLQRHVLSLGRELQMMLLGRP